MESERVALLDREFTLSGLPVGQIDVGAPDPQLTHLFGRRIQRHPGFDFALLGFRSNHPVRRIRLDVEARSTRNDVDFFDSASSNHGLQHFFIHVHSSEKGQIAQGS